MSDLTLALDIGGTKIAAGLVDADGTLVTSTQEPTPRGDATVRAPAYAPAASTG